jgi:hypothetical protein
MKTAVVAFEDPTQPPANPAAPALRFDRYSAEVVTATAAYDYVDGLGEPPD